MSANLFVTIANQTTSIYPLPNATLSAETLIDILKHVDADAAVVSPVVAQQIATDPAKLAFVFQTIHTLGFCGGGISQATGDTLARHGNIFPLYASTENGITPTFRSSAASAMDSWACIQFHPRAGYEFRHLLDNDYEAVIIRNTLADEEQPVFKVFPHLKEYSTKDLFTPHPKTPDGWVYRSRADDIITFADGTTFNPLEFEQLVSGHPDVRAALMLGNQRSQACLLIEPDLPQDLRVADISTAVDPIWLLIDKANKLCTKQAIIQGTHILFTQPEKPLPRAGKGTVQRALAMRLYAETLEALYASPQQHF